jgi:hypothetical protein
MKTTKKPSSKQSGGSTDMDRALIEAQRQEMERLHHESILLHMSRAGKLLLRGQPFVCVADDEPYYMDVYRMIRMNARLRGKWSQECERRFRSAIETWIGQVPVRMSDTRVRG